MTDFRNIQISDYTYELPESRIAKYPLSERDSSNLLIWEKGNIKKDVFRHISEYIPANSILVFNNTRVIHARLIFKKDTGSQIEVFCLEPVRPQEYQQAFQQTEKVIWKCMAGNAKKWKDESLKLKIELRGVPVELSAKKVSREGNLFTVEFNWTHGFSFAEIIEKAGILPIPPYLKRETEPTDEQTYQTIYAKTNGSVAAPTAGLHFTKKVLSNLSQKNIELHEITLHVGAGTFQPVKTNTIGGHEMHHETVVIPRSFIQELLSNPKKIIAVGTTSVRSLESLYWLGQKINCKESDPEKLEVQQWESYETKPSMNVTEALSHINDFLVSQKMEFLRFSTRLMIVPGYQFKLTKGIITNFHQPQSTLLLLIGAFLNNDWKKVYDFALKENFRFLSYGDSNLYLR